MPIYEYECKDHGVYSVYCSMADKKDQEPCPICKNLNPSLIGAPKFKWGKGEPPPTEMGKIEKALRQPPRFDSEKEKEVKEL